MNPGLKTTDAHVNTSRSQQLNATHRFLFIEWKTIKKKDYGASSEKFYLQFVCKLRCRMTATMTDEFVRMSTEL